MAVYYAIHEYRHIKVDTKNNQLEIYETKEDAKRQNIFSFGIEEVHVMRASTFAALNQLLAESEARIDAGEALLNRMSMNLMLSGYSHEGDKNNPMNDWLARVVEWKKARLECPVKEASGKGE